jgi:hypothetical protein
VSQVFNGFFAIGFCGIPFLLPMELTPLATRAKSVAIATACFWSCSESPRRLAVLIPLTDP